MILHLVQQPVPVILLPVHLLHRLSDLRISDCCKTDRIRECRRRIGIYRRYLLAAPHLILIFCLRQKPCDGRPVDIISRGDLRCFHGSRKDNRLCKIAVLRRRPENLSGFFRRRVPGQMDLFLRASHGNGQRTDRGRRDHGHGKLRRCSPVLFSGSRRFCDLFLCPCGLCFFLFLRLL